MTLRGLFDGVLAVTVLGLAGIVIAYQRISGDVPVPSKWRSVNRDSWKKWTKEQNAKVR